MKKFLLVLIASLLLSLTACGSSNKKEESSIVQDTSVIEKTESKALIVYFSRTGEQYGVGIIEKGNTAIVAEMIADYTGADLYEVEPVKDYPRTYDALTDVAKEEQNKNERPKIKGDLPDLSGYDTIFIGSPVWWGDWPMIMYTYFEANDFSGKTLIPFSTHGGSGLSGFDTKLKKAAPGAKVLEGIGIYGEDCQNDADNVRTDVTEWLMKLGF